MTKKNLAAAPKETIHKLKVLAKKKENVRGKLAVKAKTLRLKAKKLATTAKKKETTRGHLAVTAETLRLKAKKLATTAKKKEHVRGRLVVTAEKLATVAKEKETIRSKLAVTAETLRLKAKQLAVTAKEKERIKNKLAMTAKKLATVAKEKESVRSKLAVTAKNLAKLAKEKEDVRRRLAVTAKQLAVVSQERESASKYSRSLIDSNLDPLVTISPEGKITDVNAATGQMTGLARKNLIGTDFSKYFTEPKKALAGYKQVFKKGSITNYPLTIRDKAGKLIDVLYNASVYKNDKGKVLGVLAVARDVTEAKKATELVESTNKKLRALDLAKDEFVSIASHQLRTPLTALKGYTGMLLDEDAGPINQKQREYLTEIKNANDRMIVLITALLNVSRVDLGVFVVEPELIDFKKVAESVLSELEMKIKEKKLQLAINFSKNLPLVSADLKIVRMVFQNLLSNAVKYTPAGGKLSLAINKEASAILVSVTDTGYGIPENVQSKIFTKMFRADNARLKDPSGTGLGLYIVKETIEQTGGKIWFKSKENQGSTFYFSVPLSGMKKREGSKRLE